MAKSVSKNKSAAKAKPAKKTVTKKAAVKKTAVKKTDAEKSAKTAKVKKAASKKVVAKKAPVSKAKTVKKTKTKSTSTTKTGRKVEIVSTVTKTPKKVKGYSKKELAEFKQVILDKRSEIIEQLQNLKEQMMDSTTGQYVNENSPYSLHMAEQGTDAQEREKLYLWAQRETKFLGYLEDALQRIDNGTYGICIDSLELKEGPHLIPKNRLLAVPHTQHCVDCKNKKNNLSKF